MLVFAPRLAPAVLAEIDRLSRRSLPISEINRRVGRAAWRRRLPKPSYERVRVLVHAARLRSREPRRSLPRLEVGLAVGVGVSVRLGLGNTRREVARSLSARGSPGRRS